MQCESSGCPWLSHRWQYRGWARLRLDPLPPSRTASPAIASPEKGRVDAGGRGKKEGKTKEGNASSAKKKKRKKG